MTEPQVKTERLRQCPSAPSSSEDGVVFGVVFYKGDHSEVHYLTQPVPVTHELLGLTGNVPPATVLRVGAPCAQQQCIHFSGETCSLAARIVKRLGEADIEHLPACSLRKNCLWFDQEGIAACRRCPQISTWNMHPSQLLTEVSVPTGISKQLSRRRSV